MKDTAAIYEELGMDSKWHEAFASECFYKAKHNRLRFTVPLLGVFTLAFLGLFTVQSYLKAIWLCGCRIFAGNEPVSYYRAFRHSLCQVH